MRKHVEKLAIALTAATLLAGCGLQLGFPLPTSRQGAGTALKDGYYVVTSGSLASVHFPLVVLKTSGTQQNLFQVSTIGTTVFSFGRGYVTNPAPVTMATVIVRSTSGSYVGSVQGSGNDLRIQSRLITATDEANANFPLVGTIVSGQDYTVKLTDLKGFLTQLRVIVPRPVANFTAGEENDCSAAFGMTCTAAFISPL